MSNIATEDRLFIEIDLVYNNSVISYQTLLVLGFL